MRNIFFTKMVRRVTGRYSVKILKRPKELDIYGLMHDGHVTKLVRDAWADETGGNYQFEDRRDGQKNKHWKELLHEVYGGSVNEVDDYILAGRIWATDAELFRAAQFLIQHNFVRMSCPHHWDITRDGIDAELRNGEIKRDKLFRCGIIVLGVIPILLAVIL